MFTVETSMCMGIMLIAIMQFVCTGFSIEQKISNYVDNKINIAEQEYSDRDNINKTYTPAELKKCISIIENIGELSYEY